MDGMRFFWHVHGHGTLSADMISSFRLPCAATLVSVQAVATTAAAHDDAYLRRVRQELEEED